MQSLFALAAGYADEHARQRTAAAGGGVSAARLANLAAATVGALCPATLSRCVTVHPQIRGQVPSVSEMFLKRSATRPNPRSAATTGWRRPRCGMPPSRQPWQAQQVRQATAGRRPRSCCAGCTTGSSLTQLCVAGSDHYRFSISVSCFGVSSVLSTQRSEMFQGDHFGVVGQ